jgi:hypothetical protein
MAKDDGYTKRETINVIDIGQNLKELLKKAMDETMPPEDKSQTFLEALKLLVPKNNEVSRDTDRS